LTGPHAEVLKTSKIKRVVVIFRVVLFMASSPQLAIMDIKVRRCYSSLRLFADEVVAAGPVGLPRRR
jgi:hypothetical protein